MISIIIPVLNEARNLPAMITSLLAQSGNYEVIAVDGGSTDQSQAVIGEFSSARLLVSQPGRGRQMNQGARMAVGDLLLLLHADTLLPPGALLQLNKLAADPGCQFGGFRYQFSGRCWQLRLISWLTNLRCRLSGGFYGDQAIFVRHDLFESLGGFPEEPILEDMIFCERASQYARLIFVPDPVITDSRKFEQMGAWRSLFRSMLIIFCHQFRLPVKGRAFFTAIR